MNQADFILRPATGSDDFATVRDVFRVSHQLPATKVGQPQSDTWLRAALVIRA